MERESDLEERVAKGKKSTRCKEKFMSGKEESDGQRRYRRYLEIGKGYERKGRLLHEL